MRNSSLVLLVISALILGACGRMDVTRRNATAGLSEGEAMDTLMTVPMAEGRYARRGGVMNVSAEELQSILENVVKSGQVRVGGRNAVAATTDLSGLNQLFTLLQSGQANSIMGLASGLVNMNGGSATTAGSKLNSIMAILNAALPIIMTIAPQYAGIIQALTVILPLVISFIGMFKKKPAPSASVIFLSPRFA